MAFNLIETLGDPTRRVILIPRTRNKSALSVSPIYVRYGKAIEVAIAMRDLPWYETNEGYLVCGRPKDERIPVIKVELCLEDENNMTWLVNRHGKENWEDFYTRVEIKSTPNGKLCYLCNEK